MLWLIWQKLRWLWHENLTVRNDSLINISILLGLMKSLLAIRTTYLQQQNILGLEKKYFENHFWQVPSETCLMSWKVITIEKRFRRLRKNFLISRAMFAECLDPRNCCYPDESWHGSFFKPQFLTILLIGWLEFQTVLSYQMTNLRLTDFPL